MMCMTDGNTNTRHIADIVVVESGCLLIKVKAEHVLLSESMACDEQQQKGLWSAETWHQSTPGA